jgi:integrase/recombinase XerD
MLSLYRRHRADCKHRSRRYKSCSCPIWAQGVLRGATFRKSLDLTNWEAATKHVRELELRCDEYTCTVETATVRFLKDAKARGLSAPTIKKYKHLMDELLMKWGSRYVRAIVVDDVRGLRQSWTLSPTSTAKRLEFLRSFFRFCEDSGWIEKNPAKAVKAPVIRRTPTLPFSEKELEKIAWAIDSIRDIHPQIPEKTERQLRALVSLMRYSGLRISDAVALTMNRLDATGRLLVYTQKNGKPVYVKLPKPVIAQLSACDEGDGWLFWNGQGTLKSRLTEWQDRLKKVAKIAGIEGRGFAHRLRDTFSVDLLNHGASLETVAVALGNTVAIVQKHYAPWTQSRQKVLDTAVEAIW